MPRYTVVYEGDPSGVKILAGEAAPGEAVGVMTGDLIAEAVRSEKHRNDLMDSVVSLRTERGALRACVEALKADLREVRRAAAGGNALSSTADLLRWASERVVPKPDDRGVPEPRHFVERAIMLERATGRQSS